MGNTTSLALLQTAEQYADGIVTDAVRKQARQKAFTAAWWSPGKQSALSALARRPEKAAEAAAYACGYFFDSDLRLEGIALLRDIFGNPFRPVTFDPAWRTSTAVGVAEAIYADRTFDNLPVLADALQDAGCDHPDILTHLRDPGPHVRGCWALDLVLGKE